VQQAREIAEHAAERPEDMLRQLNERFGKGEPAWASKALDPAGFAAENEEAYRRLLVQFVA
jgi:hypothetical protein